MTATESPVFGIYFKNDNYYTGSLPYFDDTAKYSWVKNIESQWEVIRNEILAYISSGGSLDAFSSPTSPGLSRPDAWKKIYFMNSLWLHPANCRKLPQTWSIINKIPGITLGAVLILEPRGRILPHCSESNVNIRCHLGIKIPASLPQCGLQVGPEQRDWQEGKVIMFNDCHEHSVWNNTDETRIIVAFDILQPAFANRRVWLCAKYLSALSIRSLDVYIPFRKYLSTLSIKLIHTLIGALWYAYLPIQSIFINAFSRR